MSLSVFDDIARLGVIPVVAIDSPEAAIPLADALIEGGLPIVEITFRTAAAAEVLRVLHAERPGLLAGAGTVLTRENLMAAHESGARFGVAPGLDPAIVEGAHALGLPFVPGIATASEIEQAMSLGCKVVKFFPAEALGGVAMLQALSGPFAHTGVRFVPTGGVTMKNLEQYLRLPTVAAVGGTWLAKPDDLAAGRFAEIRDRAREAAAVVARVRGTG